VELKGELKVEKKEKDKTADKATGKIELLLFVFGISLAVFILLFLIIYTVISIVKKYRKGEISLLRAALEQLPDTANRPQSEEWPVEEFNLHKEGAVEKTDAYREAKRILAQRNLH
jgi:hypothetical protein